MRKLQYVIMGRNNDANDKNNNDKKAKRKKSKKIKTTNKIIYNYQ